MDYILAATLDSIRCQLPFEQHRLVIYCGKTLTSEPWCAPLVQMVDLSSACSHAAGVYDPKPPVLDAAADFSYEIMHVFVAVDFLSGLLIVKKKVIRI